MLELLEWGAIALAIYYFIKILFSEGFQSMLEGISLLLPERKRKKLEKEEWEKELNRSMEESLKRKEKNVNKSSYDLNEK